MNLHRDLLRQSRTLALIDPRRPQQANLRRSISAAYYALFHLLTDEASRRMMRGADRAMHRNTLRRAFSHGEMRTASRAFVSPNPPAWLTVTGVRPSAEVRIVAGAFESLQEIRHDADYDHGVSFTRSSALEAVDRAEEAFAAWDTIHGQPDADLFLIALLVRPR